MEPVTLLLALVVGVVLGLLGGGGSILMVPLLVYIAGQDAKQAIATSLLVVASTAAIAAIPHARAGRVSWRTAGIFGAAGMAGAYAGGRLGSLVEGRWLLLAFAAMMIVTAVAMLRDRRLPATDADGATGEHGPRPVLRIALDGVGVGLVTGLVGAGGGFLVVPALVLLGGLSMPTAVGTSLVIIAMKSFAGLAGYLGTVNLDWPAAGTIVVAAATGAMLGARFVTNLDPSRLRRGFGWFVVAMSAVMVAQELPLTIAIPVIVLAVGTVVVLVRRGPSDDTDDGPTDPTTDRSTQEVPA